MNEIRILRYDTASLWLARDIRRALLLAGWEMVLHGSLVRPLFPMEPRAMRGDFKLRLLEELEAEKRPTTVLVLKRAME